jgi:3-oxoacyl-[acyl-carrier-protein] synthase-3
VVGWGKAIPPHVLTNQDLEAIVETSDEWIRSRTGIEERRIADMSQSTADLAVEAGKKALEVANILPRDVDLIIVATSTPEHIFPSTASLVQDRLGATHAGAYDLSAACSGFVYALDQASAKVRTGDVEIALVIGAETMSRVMNWSDRTTCILFGDGAGAMVLRGLSEPGGIMSSLLRSDGAGWDLLGVPTVGSRDAYLPERASSPLELEDGEETFRPARELHRLHMNGREVYRFANRVVADSVREVARMAQLEVEDIDLIVPHQANQRIMEMVAKQLKISPDKLYSNVARYGNTSAASIPVAMVEAIEEGRVKPGDNIVFVGFGGGLSWAEMALRWDVTSEAADRLDGLRRTIFYRYVIWRRSLLRWWRRVGRAFSREPYPDASLKDLQKHLDEQEP